MVFKCLLFVLFPLTFCSSGVLWVHAVFALLYLILTAATMFYYVLQLGKYQSDYVSTLNNIYVRIYTRIFKN